MAKNPADPDGWRMLGWSYFQTERFADAATAYGKAVALRPDGPGYQSAYGEALALAASGNITPASRTAFEKAVAQDRNDARARFFIGQAKAQGGDAKGAIDDWLALLADSATDAPWVPQLRAMLSETAKAAGIDITARLAAIRQPTSGGASVAAPPAAGASADPAAPGPSADQIAGAASMTPADRQAMIASMVERLATRLAANPRDEAGWLRLIRARSVMGDAAATRKARDDALKAFADDAAATARIKAAAAELGV
jgi:cytochrome c-type biogenesis protein CcmH